MESTLYGRKIKESIIISENDLTQASLSKRDSHYFKFYIPLSIDHAFVFITNIIFSSENDSLLVRLNAMKPPSEKNYIKEETIFPNSSSTVIMFFSIPDSWHYLEFKLRNNTFPDQTSSNFTFTVKYFTNMLSTEYSTFQYLENKTLFNNSYSKTFHNNKLTDLVPYKQYNLVRDASSETFIFSYELEEELYSKVAIPVNMTNEHFSVFKFRVNEGTDIGGTMQFILAFKSNTNVTSTVESTLGNHTVVACIRKGLIEVPTWPGVCVSNGFESTAPLILNKTVVNSTILIPYPEFGTWYATFKLFCGKCEPCKCPQDCQMQYEQCTKECDQNCSIVGNCEQCTMNCSNAIISKKACEKCDCDGPCLKKPKSVCNTSIVFNIGSHPCIFGQCSKNGRCVFMVSDGVVFSTCVCINKYRGE